MPGFERYHKDIERLVKEGGKLVLAMQRVYQPDSDTHSDFTKEELEKLPDFHSCYQRWYSEALALVSQLIPEREEDFRGYYSPRGSRKDILYSNYTISDALRGVTIRSFGEIVTDPAAAIQPMYQQFNIVSGLVNRFRSTLYDIKTLVHADLLDCTETVFT